MYTYISVPGNRNQLVGTVALGLGYTQIYNNSVHAYMYF